MKNGGRNGRLKAIARWNFICYQMLKGQVHVDFEDEIHVDLIAKRSLKFILKF